MAEDREQEMADLVSLLADVEASEQVWEDWSPQTSDPRTALAILVSCAESSMSYHPEAVALGARVLAALDKAGSEQQTKAAKVIWETSRADEGTISATGADHVARALAEAGLLAPETGSQALQGGQEEWGVLWTWASEEGVHDRCRSREVAEFVAAQDRHGLGVKGTVVRRVVTAWTPWGAAS